MSLPVHLYIYISAYLHTGPSASPYSLLPLRRPPGASSRKLAHLLFSSLALVLRTSQHAPLWPEEAWQRGIKDQTNTHWVHKYLRDEVTGEEARVRVERFADIDVKSVVFKVRDTILKDL